MTKLSERERHIRIFGELKSLEERVGWTSGVDNLFEWATWYTNNILGITKTTYWKKIIGWLHEAEMANADVAAQYEFVKRKLAVEVAQTEMLDRYAPPKSSLASPREALRRAKFFSEDYLNKEFDIFWSLSSRLYLDKFYRQFVQVQGGGTWFCHGHSQRFANSVDMQFMQMDSLSYNSEERLLVANELKLGGRKNPDQILKYARMVEHLYSQGFLPNGCQFVLLFIGDSPQIGSWEDEIEKEIEHCTGRSKPSAKALLDPAVLARARSTDYASTTWQDLLQFNQRYLAELHPDEHEVEYKLIWGFNQALASKAFLQSSAKSK